MSQLSRAILGAIAVSLTLGAVQFASGRDLAGIRQSPRGAPETAINRAAKADRAARVLGMTMQTQTISLRLDGLSDTSVLIRMPLAKATRSISPPPSLLKSGGRKMAVACEPVVSVLTDLAKQLEPGRCVT
jgi:hypothetical protein